MEIVDIDLDNVGSSSSSSDSVNFGSGIELLMNEKKKSGSNRVDLGELDNLEAELNTLSETTPVAPSTNNSNTNRFSYTLKKFSMKPSFI